MKGSEGKSVLHGVRVLDCSRAKAGPTCGQILADMGAEVIRVEMPGGDFDRFAPPYGPSGQGMYLMFTCRNKMGITLNLTKEKGRKILGRLVKKSDIVIENLGPAANKKLGLDYESLAKIKQDIIAVSISAFGQNGPYANRPGFDGIAQAMSGLMWVTGFPTGVPVRMGVSFIDSATGVHAALGAMLALYHRKETGYGQLVDVSLLDVAFSFTESIMGEERIEKRVRQQDGNASVLAAPYDAFKASDGWVFLGAPTDSLWKALCRVTGREELAYDPRFKTMRDRLQPERRQFYVDWLSSWVSQKTAAEVVTTLNGAGVPCGPVNTVSEAASDPQIVARNMVVELEHQETGSVPVVGIPMKLSRTPGEVRMRAPDIGEHNEYVYRKLLGLDTNELFELKTEGVI